MAIEQDCLFHHDFGPRQNHLRAGVRPASVVQTDMLNRLEGYPNVIVVPITTKPRKSPTYVELAPTAESGLTAASWAITNQIFTIDKQNLGAPMGRVKRSELFAVKQALKVAFDLSS